MQIMEILFHNLYNSENFRSKYRVDVEKKNYDRVYIPSIVRKHVTRTTPMPDFEGNTI